jgi:hypothetical protein
MQPFLSVTALMETLHKSCCFIYTQINRWAIATSGTTFAKVGSNPVVQRQGFEVRTKIQKMYVQCGSSETVTVPLIKNEQ